MQLKEWAKSNFETFGLIGNFTKSQIGNISVVKTVEDVHLGGDYVYFFKKNKIVYTITGPSKDSIEEIILNGN